MSLFISGTCATIFYSSEAYPTRISVGFARSLKRRSQPFGSQVPLSVTAATSTGAFTAVLHALVDPLCEEDVVLGKDWIDRCASNNVLPQLELPPVYNSGELLPVKRSHLLTCALPQRYHPFSYQSALPLLQVRRLFFLATYLADALTWRWPCQRQHQKYETNAVSWRRARGR